jgi:hypothetical protein
VASVLCNSHRTAARGRAATPTLAALGPLGRLEDFEHLRDRLGA